MTTHDSTENVLTRLFLYFIYLFDYFIGFKHQRDKIEHYKKNGAKVDKAGALMKYLGQKI